MIEAQKEQTFSLGIYCGPSLSLHFTTCKLKCMCDFAFKCNFISSLSFDFKFSFKQKLNFYFICYFKCVCKVILKNINIFRANYNHEIHIFLKVNIKLLINKKYEIQLSVSGVKKNLKGPALSCY